MGIDRERSNLQTAADIRAENARRREGSRRDIQQRHTLPMPRRGQNERAILTEHINELTPRETEPGVADDIRALANLRRETNDDREQTWGARGEDLRGRLPEEITTRIRELQQDLTRLRPEDTGERTRLTRNLGFYERERDRRGIT